jgi:hypothetical protein
MGLIDPIEGLEYGGQLQCEGEGSMCKRHGSDVIMVKFSFCDDHLGSSSLYGHDKPFRATDDGGRLPVYRS